MSSSAKLSVELRVRPRSTSMASPFMCLMSELTQCGTIIVFGYICHAAHIFSHSDVDGISRFVARVALPSLILLNMSSLDMSSLAECAFVVAAVMTAKALLFAIVVAVTAITSLSRIEESSASDACEQGEQGANGSSTRPWMRRAGLHAIFATQSNDFALGLPLLEAIWPGLHIRLQPIFVLALLTPST